MQVQGYLSILRNFVLVSNCCSNHDCQPCHLLQATQFDSYDLANYRVFHLQTDGIKGFVMIMIISIIKVIISTRALLIGKLHYV